MDRKRKYEAQDKEKKIETKRKSDKSVNGSWRFRRRTSRAYWRWEAAKGLGWEASPAQYEEVRRASVLAGGQSRRQRRCLTDGTLCKNNADFSFTAT